MRPVRVRKSKRGRGESHEPPSHEPPHPLSLVDPKAVKAAIEVLVARTKAAEDLPNLILVMQDTLTLVNSMAEDYGKAVEAVQKMAKEGWREIMLHPEFDNAGKKVH